MKGSTMSGAAAACFTFSSRGMCLAMLSSVEGRHSGQREPRQTGRSSAMHQRKPKRCAPACWKEAWSATFT